MSGERLEGGGGEGGLLLLNRREFVPCELTRSNQIATGEEVEGAPCLPPTAKALATIS